MDEQKMEQKPDERRLPERLLAIQNELKAPKGQYNSFGKYKYRSAEDILEAVKPLAEQHSVLIYCSDDIVMVGNRIYVKATATAEDVTGRCSAITVTAFAREPDDKKGMDASQITGTASSYARKYALNGLLCIDDAKDADTDAYQTAGNAPTAKQKFTAATAKSPYKPQRARMGDCISRLTFTSNAEGFASTAFRHPRGQENDRQKSVCKKSQSPLRHPRAMQSAHHPVLTCKWDCYRKPQAGLRRLFL